MTAFLPIRLSPSPRPTVVVVLPSPARRVDGGDEDQLAVAALRQRGDEILTDLRLVVTVGRKRLGGDAELGTHIHDRLLHRGARDLDIGFDARHGFSFSSRQSATGAPSIAKRQSRGNSQYPQFTSDGVLHTAEPKRERAARRRTALPFTPAPRRLEPLRQRDLEGPAWLGIEIPVCRGRGDILRLERIPIGLVEDIVDAGLQTQPLGLFRLPPAGQVEDAVTRRLEADGALVGNAAAPTQSSAVPQLSCS